MECSRQNHVIPTRVNFFEKTFSLLLYIYIYINSNIPQPNQHHTKQSPSSLTFITFFLAYFMWWEVTEWECIFFVVRTLTVGQSDNRKRESQPNWKYKKLHHSLLCISSFFFFFFNSSLQLSLMDPYKVYLIESLCMYIFWLCRTSPACMHACIGEF